MLLEFFFGWHYNFSTLCSEQGPCHWFCIPGNHTARAAGRRPTAFSLLSVQPSAARQAPPHVQTRSNREVPSLQPWQVFTCNRPVTADVTEVHTAGARLLQAALFQG
ncbi:hypothetical protein PSN_5048 [Pseudomonas sp. NGC7]